MKRQRNNDIAGIGDIIREDRDGAVGVSEVARSDQRESKQRRTSKRRTPTLASPYRDESESAHRIRHPRKCQIRGRNPKNTDAIPRIPDQNAQERQASQIFGEFYGNENSSGEDQDAVLKQFSVEAASVSLADEQTEYEEMEHVSRLTDVFECDVWVAIDALARNRHNIDAAMEYILEGNYPDMHPTEVFGHDSPDDGASSDRHPSVVSAAISEGEPRGSVDVSDAVASNLHPDHTPPSSSSFAASASASASPDVPLQKTSQGTCPVCLEEYDSSDNVKCALSCGHMVCGSCIDGMLAVADHDHGRPVKLCASTWKLPITIRCPVCRIEVVTFTRLF